MLKLWHDVIDKMNGEFYGYFNHRRPKNKLVVQAGADIDLHVHADELAVDMAIYSQVKLYVASN